ncbi:MAG: VWA domain-containing protein [Chloroflexota bacterium]|nr:VWA domain-containing protein [Chloroflexota bacterium]
MLFGRLLRGLGVTITPAQIVDLADSLQYVAIGNRQDFKNSARAVLISRQEHLALFEAAFDLFWQARSENDFSEIDLGKLLRRRQTPKSQVVYRPSHSGVAGEETAETQVDPIYTYNNQELLRQKDFAHLDDSELAAVKRLMARTVWTLPPRRTRRSVRADRGPQLDLRRTLRQNLRHGGEFLHLARRKRKVKRRPLVVICDISGSMERYSRVLLQFIYVVTSRLDRVESFVFGTRLTRITRQLRVRNIDQALREASATVVDWGGGTRIGESIKTFNYTWSRRVLNGGAIVLIISDGWDRGDVDLLAREMDRLHRSCHRLIWLNPLLGAADYAPLVRGIQAAMPYIDDFLPVHNLASLEQLAATLAAQT